MILFDIMKNAQVRIKSAICSTKNSYRRTNSELSTDFMCY